MSNMPSSSPRLIMWSALGIVCPHCGNRGEDDGGWRRNCQTPFRLVEDVPRLWLFSAVVDLTGTLRITADARRDQVDWEGGTNLRFACMSCFGDFPLPERASVDFE